MEMKWDDVEARAARSLEISWAMGDPKTEIALLPNIDTLFTWRSLGNASSGMASAIIRMSLMKIFILFPEILSEAVQDIGESMN